MVRDTTYLFTSQRLGFRCWRETDIDRMAAINADPSVMEFFPAPQDRTQTVEFVERMRLQFAESGFCYFAVDKLAGREFIGFIGLSEQTFEADFTPCVDIGWRLAKKEWNKGFATEGAKRCLEYGFHQLNLQEIYSMTPKPNRRSENVMKKIGMQKAGSFKHPLLAASSRLEICLLYLISNPDQC